MRYINQCFFFTSLIALDVGVVIIPNCNCAFTLHKWPNQESQTNKKLILLSETPARPFLFSSASLRSNGAEKGTWKLTGRGNQSLRFGNSPLLPITGISEDHVISFTVGNKYEIFIAVLSSENTWRGDRNVPASLI